MSNCPFCRIARKEVRAHIVCEDERLLAFLFTGGDEPHAHAHVVPLHEKTDITSRRYIAERELTFRAAPRATDAALATVARQLRAGMA